MPHTHTHTYTHKYIYIYIYIYNGDQQLSPWIEHESMKPDSVKHNNYPHFDTYRLMWGARGVMVIIVGNGNGNGNPRSNEAACLSDNVNTLWKGMNKTILPSAMGK